ncbi:hypothetical protein EPUL_006362, partial [Erysiphe pulchra]
KVNFTTIPIHQVFGTTKFIRFIKNIPKEKREIAVKSFLYEAHARLREPVLGCVSYTIHLEQQLCKLSAEVESLKAQLHKDQPPPSHPGEHSAENEEEPINMEVEEQSTQRLNRRVDLSTDSDSQLVEVEVQVSPHYLEHLNFTPNSSWVNPVFPANSEVSSVSNSPSSPISPTTFIQPVTRNNPTGSHPTWAELINHYQSHYFNDTPSTSGGSSNTSSLNKPMSVEPISAIPPTSENLPFSFFNLPRIKTKRVQQLEFELIKPVNKCEAMESVSDLNHEVSTEDLVLSTPATSESKQTTKIPPKEGMKQRSMFQGKSLYALRRSAKRGKPCSKCLHMGCPEFQSYNPEDGYHYIPYFRVRRAPVKAHPPTGWKAE